MPFPDLLHPEPLPLQKSTADVYFHRRHSNTVLGVSVGSLGPGAHKVLFVPFSVYFPVLCKFWRLCGGVNGDLL